MRQLFKWWWGMTVLLVAVSAVAVETEDNYENKIVEVTELALKNGCTVVEIVTETKRGANTTPTLERERWVACPHEDTTND